MQRYTKLRNPPSADCDERSRSVAGAPAGHHRERVGHSLQALEGRGAPSWWACPTRCLLHAPLLLSFAQSRDRLLGAHHSPSVAPTRRTHCVVIPRSTLYMRIMMPWDRRHVRTAIVVASFCIAREARRGNAADPPARCARPSTAAPPDAFRQIVPGVFPDSILGFRWGAGS